MYLTYEEYQNMGGTLSEPEFNDLERQSEIYIDDYTFKRLREDTEYPAEVKDCVYELIKLVATRKAIISASSDGNVSPQIASQSNDGVSISYNVISAADVFTQMQDEIVHVIKITLYKVRNSKGHLLTYRGIYPDE